MVCRQPLPIAETATNPLQILGVHDLQKSGMPEIGTADVKGKSHKAANWPSVNGAGTACMTAYCDVPMSCTRRPEAPPDRLGSAWLRWDVDADGRAMPWDGHGRL